MILHAFFGWMSPQTGTVEVFRKTKLNKKKSKNEQQSRIANKSIYPPTRENPFNLNDKYLE